MASGYLPVAGTGVRLPGAADAAGVYARLLAGQALAGQSQRLVAERTDLPPVAARVGLCAAVSPPARPVRTAGLPRESQLAVCAAADALAGQGGSSAQGTGVAWVSSTAGLAEYGEVCVAAATLPPGQASPLTAPQSGYNGPAAAVSIRLGLTGPHLTMTGDRAAGATALVEAGRLLDEQRCGYVLVGGSAAVDRWRLAGPDGAGADGAGGDDPVPAEGAVCVLLGGSDGAAGIRALRRARLRAPDPPARPTLSDFVDQCLALLAGPPDAVALCAAPPWRAAAERAFRPAGVPCWPIERIAGELGAAGGLQAVVAAVAACQPPGGLSRVLALTVGGAGDAVAIEVVSRDVVSRGKEQRDEPL